jgi:hypothetical protein
MPDENIRSGETFHAHLGRLYERAVEHEREVLWGPDALLTLYTLDYSGGYLSAMQLTSGWSASRNTVVAGVEEWRLDVLVSNDAFYELADVAAVAITSHGLPQQFKVVQCVRPELSGHAWMLSLIPTGELR